MDITHDNVCSSMLSCFYSHLLSTGRPISSCFLYLHIKDIETCDTGWVYQFGMCGQYLNTLTKELVKIQI